jgi:thiamine-phosphate pyrophosphorylase
MISRLHYITQELEGHTHAALAEWACLGGADWIQLRVKNKSYNEHLDIALKTEAVCRKYHARLIINDNVKIAKAIKANGVHLGKTDMHPSEAREMLGTEFIIGGTANTFDDIRELVLAGVDYIGLGPFQFTQTKENLSPVIGLEGYEAIIKKCASEKINIPIIAIGGIKAGDVKPLLEKGLYGIAVSSAINLSENKKETTKHFIHKIKSFLEKK